jgi:hypothetical protein
METSTREPGLDFVAALNAARARTQRVNEAFGAALRDRRAMQDQALLRDSPQIAAMQARIAELTAQYAAALIAQGEAHLAEVRPRWNAAQPGYLESDAWIRANRSWDDVSGGGASDVRQGGSALANRVVVAGGGGGDTYCAAGGTGGSIPDGSGLPGGNGSTLEAWQWDAGFGGVPPYVTAASGGGGGAATSGGSGGTGFLAGPTPEYPALQAGNGAAGTFGLGGAGGTGVPGNYSGGSTPLGSGGAGGGGGYYGGGGGGGGLNDFCAIGAGGGGGSSFAESTATGVSYGVATDTGLPPSVSLDNGRVVISW